MAHGDSFSACQVGVSLLLVGIVALNQVRMEIPLEKENQTKLVKFMIRMGVFSALYLVPLLTVIGCYLYEHTYRSVWETTWMEENCRRYHIPCPYKVEHGDRAVLDATVFAKRFIFFDITFRLCPNDCDHVAF